MVPPSAVNPLLNQTSALGIVTFGKIKTTPFDQFILQIFMNSKLRLAQTIAIWPSAHGAGERSQKNVAPQH
jgi:hypothetical protein